MSHPADMNLSRWTARSEKETTNNFCSCMKPFGCAGILLSVWIIPYPPMFVWMPEEKWEKGRVLLPQNRSCWKFYKWGQWQIFLLLGHLLWGWSVTFSGMPNELIFLWFCWPDWTKLKFYVHLLNIISAPTVGGFGGRAELNKLF